MTFSRRTFAGLLAAAALSALAPDGPAAGQQIAADRAPPGILALPEGAAKAPAVLLLPDPARSEAWVRARADDLAGRGFIAFAPADRDIADGRPVEAAGWLRDHPRGTGAVGVVGWGSGGGRVLDVALAAPVTASVIFSAPVERPSDVLRALQGPLMVHLGRRDPGVAMDPTNFFIGEMRKAGKAVEIYWYEAGANFTDPQAGAFDAFYARLAWERTLDFLDARLRD